MRKGETIDDLDYGGKGRSRKHRGPLRTCRGKQHLELVVVRSYRDAAKTLFDECQCRECGEVVTREYRK